VYFKSYDKFREWACIYDFNGDVDEDRCSENAEWIDCVPLLPPS
jgi:hypothetical protein